MIKPKIVLSQRKLDLPVYQFPDNKPKPKSTFIDSNRIDTIRSEKSYKNNNNKDE